MSHDVNNPTQRRTQSGLYGLMRKVSARGLTALDQRSAGARALLEWRSELIADLGGLRGLSAQQRTLIELAVRARLYLDHLDGYLMAQDSLINKRRKSALPILAQRMQLSESLARYLSQLGIERVEPPQPSLQDYIAQKDREKEARATE